MFNASDFDRMKKEYETEYSNKMYQMEEREFEIRKLDEMIAGKKFALITNDRFIYEYENSEIESYPDIKTAIITNLNNNYFKGIVVLRDDGWVVIIQLNDKVWDNYNNEWDRAVNGEGGNKTYNQVIDALIDRGYSFKKRIREEDNGVISGTLNDKYDIDLMVKKAGADIINNRLIPNRNGYLRNFADKRVFRNGTYQNYKGYSFDYQKFKDILQKEIDNSVTTINENDFNELIYDTLKYMSQNL